MILVFLHVDLDITKPQKNIFEVTFTQILNLKRMMFQKRSMIFCRVTFNATNQKIFNILCCLVAFFNSPKDFS